MSVASIISRILEILAAAKTTPHIDIQMRGSQIVLSADMGAAGRAAAMAGESGVTEDAVLRVLERKRAGFNLGSVAKSLDIRRKTALKPVLAALVATGKVEKASGGKFRLPGRVRRGRRPGSASKPAEVQAVKPVPAVRPKQSATPRKPAVKAVKPASKPAKITPKPVQAKRKRAASTKRPAAVKQMERAEPASTPVTTDEPAPADPPPAEEPALGTERQEDAA